MEVLLSVFILSFIIAFLSYDFFQKYKKINNSKDSINANTESTAGHQNHKETISNDPDSTNILDKNQKSDEDVGYSKKQEKNHTPSYQQELLHDILKIEEIVERGLYGGENHEKCLNEIKKIITKFNEHGIDREYRRNYDV